jgi:hypothetical protein
MNWAKIIKIIKLPNAFELGSLVLLLLVGQVAVSTEQHGLLLFSQLGLILLQLVEIGDPVGHAASGLGHREPEVACLVAEDDLLAGGLLLLLKENPQYLMSQDIRYPTYLSFNFEIPVRVGR